MFRRRRSADDFAEEIKSHLELQADALQGEGLCEEEAYRRARVEFGSSQAAQERFYLSSRIVWFDNLLDDIKFAIRQLIRNPSFTSIAIATLALSIAANSTIFSWINSTLLDPIPGIAHTSDMITIMRGERSEHPTPPFRTWTSRIFAMARGPSPGCSPITTTTWRSPNRASPSAFTEQWRRRITLRCSVCARS